MVHHHIHFADQDSAVQELLPSSPAVASFGLTSPRSPNPIIPKINNRRNLRSLTQIPLPPSPAKFTIHPSASASSLRSSMSQRTSSMSTTTSQHNTPFSSHPFSTSTTKFPFPPISSSSSITSTAPPTPLPHSILINHHHHQTNQETSLNPGGYHPDPSSSSVLGLGSGPGSGSGSHQHQNHHHSTLNPFNHNQNKTSTLDSSAASYPERESLSPHSTVTTETGKQLLCRIKAASAGYNKQNSWSSGSGRANDATTTLTSNQKFSMKQISIFPPKMKRRVVHKNGFINVCKEKIEKRHQRYLQDTFTTMVDIQWRWNLLVFALSFLFSWLGFAVIWWMICLAHGDIDNIGNTSWTPCVVGVTSFSSAFLFSIETQHTIGYGTRSTTEECPEAIFIMCLQSITGVVIQCFVVGFVFAKLSRPQKRSQTLLFTSNAVINVRDGKMCLMFRIGDVRNRSHIIGASVSALIINKKTTKEGESLPYYQMELPIQFDASAESLFFIWPATFVHVIDQNSPFYNMNADMLIREKFEIVVILEGTVESTGQSIQARSSYLPSEILWGRRFEQLIGFKRDTSEHRVDYSKFHHTYEIDTPSCSAREMYEMKIAKNKNRERNNPSTQPAVPALVSGSTEYYKNNQSGPVFITNRVPSPVPAFPHLMIGPNSTSVTITEEEEAIIKDDTPRVEIPKDNFQLLQDAAAIKIQMIPPTPVTNPETISFPSHTTISNPRFPVEIVEG